METLSTRGASRVLGGFGPHGQPGTELPPVPAAALEALEIGQVWCADVVTPSPLACVPLRIHGQTCGALVVFSVLQQKSHLNPADFELLDLLSTHAAHALHLTSHYPEAAIVPGFGEGT